MLNGWYRWDTGWYLKVAIFGFDPQDGSVGFQPLYPFLIRVTSITGVNYLLVALIISNTCALVALFLFHLFAFQELGRQNMLIKRNRPFSLPVGVFPLCRLHGVFTLALTLATWPWLGLIWDGQQ